MPENCKLIDNDEIPEAERYAPTGVRRPICNAHVFVAILERRWVDRETRWARYVPR